MNKILKYLANTILFVVIWCIPAFLFIGYSVSVNGARLSAIAAIGGIIAIIISYKLVKKINKSKLWLGLFAEAIVNELAEEKTESKVTISRRRHFLKAISWNFLAMATTFFVLSSLPPYFGFEPLDKSQVGWLVILDRVAKLIFYYFHERTWFASNWGIIKPPKD
jgi:hypothetical protein